MLERLKSHPIVPSITQLLHKGSCGRIGVVGGSSEYTGAPFYAAISSLRTGSDLVYIFTHKDAAPIIQGYSPELIVYPQTDSINTSLLNKCDAIVIGPGLSRSAGQLQLGYEFLCKAKELNIPVVLDADGLYLPIAYPNFFTKPSIATLVLTPNKREFQVLCEKFDIDTHQDQVDNLENLKKLATKLHACIVLKGAQDYIVSYISPQDVLSVDVPGGLRRCGGQGDLLAGALGTFLAWSNKSSYPNEKLAAYAACTLIKTCSRNAYEKHKRGLICSDIIPEIAPTFNNLFDLFES